MSSTWQEIVPEPLHGPVKEALTSTYGSTPVECLGPITGGASGAVALRLRAGGHDHLLRVEAYKHPARNPHQYRCMEIAALAEIAPPLHYVEASEGVAVMDFIHPVSLAQFPGGPPALMAAQGAMARALQAAPAFPELRDFRTVASRLLGIAESRVAPGLLDEHRKAFEGLVQGLEWDGASHVSSHNDPNPRNVLYDGERLWLIDWETAYRNDPFVDVAIMADQPGLGAELTRRLLAAWLGRAASPSEEHRLAQITLLTRAYYAGLLFAISGPAGLPLDSLEAPSAADFAAQVAGVATPSQDILLTMAKMRLRDFMLGYTELDRDS